ncbi:MAG: HAD family hydrolase [Acidimicrobiales bacterium]
MGRPDVRAITFDLDETLLDNSFIPATIADCCRHAALVSGLDGSLIAAANAEVWAEYWPTAESGWALGSPTGAELRLDVWRRALARCGCADESVLAAIVEEHERLDAAAVHLFDDVGVTIDLLRGAGMGIGLVTNGASDTQRSRLKNLGIEDWFDAIVISAEVGALKPDRAVFDRVVSMLSMDATAVWHVGDNLLTDVAGSRNAGMTAVWLNRAGTARLLDDPEPHMEISSLSHLPARIISSAE